MTPLIEELHQPHVQLLLRLIVGGLLVLAGVTKLADRASFRAAVAEYELLPKAMERPFAFALPLLEVTLGGLLIVGLATTVAAALAVPLFLGFAAAIGLNLARGRHFDCHCFGSLQSDPIGWPALLRSAGLGVIALVAALGATPFAALDSALWGAGRDLPPAAEAVPMVLLAFVVFDVLILLPEAAASRLSFGQFQRSRGVGAGGHRAHEAAPKAGANA